MEEKLLDVKNLQVEFETKQGTVHAVRDVSFYVKKGEVLGIVGESGSGKSISVMSCMGLLAKNGKVVSGDILFDGENISSAGLQTKKEKKQYESRMNALRGNEISMIFQDPMTFLNPVLKIGTQVTEGILAHTGCSRAEAWQKGIELLKLVGIPAAEKRMHQYPYEFSGGMRQRIIIAIALSCNPKLLIADEPTTALDVTVQAQILELIKERTEERGTAVIMITHDLGVVASMCQRIVILYGGKIVEEGTTDEIFYEARHPYTKGLLGSVARRGEDTAKGQPLASIPGSPPDLLKINSGCPFVNRCECAMKICKDYLPARTAESDTHAYSCWLFCKEQAAEIVAEQDRKQVRADG